LGGAGLGLDLVAERGVVVLGRLLDALPGEVVLPTVVATPDTVLVHDAVGE
jgi:hypothetical protein